MTRILRQEGADPRVSGMLFKAVVQEVLLSGLETWVMKIHMEWALGSFQRRFARQINRRQPRRQVGGGMVVSTSDISYGGGGIRRDQGLHPKEAEYFHTIYCDATNSVPL